MGKIINFKSKNSNGEITPEKIDADIARIKRGMDILTCTNRNIGLAIRYAETLRNDVYSISIMENVTEERQTMMRTTDNYEHGIEVYRELEQHVLNEDRTFTELCGILNTKL